MSLGHNDIVGRYVAMNDSALMGRLQARSDAAGQLQELVIFQRSFLEDVREGSAVDEFHRQVRTPQDRFNREYEIPDDGVVHQIMKSRRLLAKQGDSCVIRGHARQQHLDGYR